MRPPTRINLSAAQQEQFHSLVDRSDEQPTACWEWQGDFFKNGYGQFVIPGSSVAAHRAAFWLKHRRQPKDKVLHECDNPACCRPDHLFEGTSQDNIQDCIQKGRWRFTVPITKLTPEQKQLAITSKTPAWKLARDFGCSPHNIWRIRREDANRR